MAVISQGINEYGWLKTAKCSFCGSEIPKGWWRIYYNEKEPHLYCCRKCAIETLPALIADSVCDGFEDDMNRVMDEMMKAFWRAMALAKMRNRYARFNG